MSPLSPSQTAQAPPSPGTWNAGKENGVSFWRDLPKADDSPFSPTGQESKSPLPNGEESKEKIGPSLPPDFSGVSSPSTPPRNCAKPLRNSTRANVNNLTSFLYPSNNGEAVNISNISRVPLLSAENEKHASSCNCCSIS